MLHPPLAWHVPTDAPPPLNILLPHQPPLRPPGAASDTGCHHQCTINAVTSLIAPPPPAVPGWRRSWPWAVSPSRSPTPSAPSSTHCCGPGCTTCPCGAPGWTTCWTCWPGPGSMTSWPGRWRSKRRWVGRCRCCRSTPGCGSAEVHAGGTGCAGLTWEDGLLLCAAHVIASQHADDKAG
jgi:hypothetical protein